MAEITYLVNKPFVTKWVNDQIPGHDNFPLDSVSFGVCIDGKLRGGVVYTNFTGNGIMMNVASDGSKQWITKKLIRMCFGFPFLRLGCTRITGLVRTDNLEAQQFDEKLGFKKEGVIRKGDDDGCDLILYGMLKEECRWIKRNPHG